MSTLTLVPSRRAPQIFVQTNQNTFSSTLPATDLVHHVAVFFNPQIDRLPENYSLGIYLCGNDREIFLGSISNETPSQIFRLNFLPDNQHYDAVISALMMPNEQLSGPENLEEMVSMSQENLLNRIATKLYKSFENYINGCEPLVFNNEEFISMKKLNAWFQNFERKVKFNKRFWDDV